jgi:hypothetical protein
MFAWEEMSKIIRQDVLPKMMMMMMMMIQLRDQLMYLVRCTERAAVLLNFFSGGFGFESCRGT